MGRTKRSIKLSESKRSRLSTFSRRQACIFKLADELAKKSDELAKMADELSKRPDVEPFFNNVLERLMGEEPKEIFSKRNQENLEKMTVEQEMEVLVAFKGKLVALRAEICRVQERKASASLLMLSRETNDPRNYVE
ncbi:uncharacterized protein LOC111832429 [Capsella rubella]|uniref:uncharacterized protein LOC111832429 n=1 Tax=Capsella rubella TaxID=81985 RepID=UPI000CD507BB|nr:uncharacterized protein LOC111832429 [Capsella rubella]